MKGLSWNFSLGCCYYLYWQYLFKYEVRKIIILRHQGAVKAAQGHHTLHSPGTAGQHFLLFFPVFKVLPTDVNINQQTAATSHPHLIRYKNFHIISHVTFTISPLQRYSIQVNTTTWTLLPILTTALEQGPLAFKLW